jgi:hypothetical protein
VNPCRREDREWKLAQQLRLRMHRDDIVKEPDRTQRQRPGTYQITSLVKYKAQANATITPTPPNSATGTR